MAASYSDPQMQSTLDLIRRYSHSASNNTAETTTNSTTINSVSDTGKIYWVYVKTMCMYLDRLSDYFIKCP